MFGELVTDIFQTLTSCSLHSIGPACPWSGRGDWCRALAAVVLLVVVQPELEAVVAPADQVAPAAPVSVILAAVPGPVTVPLPLPTWVLRSAAPLAVEVSPSTSLTWNSFILVSTLHHCVIITCRRLEGNPGRDLRQRLRSQEGLRKVAAIILRDHRLQKLKIEEI